VGELGHTRRGSPGRCPAHMPVINATTGAAVMTTAPRDPNEANPAPACVMTSATPIRRRTTGTGQRTGHHNGQPGSPLTRRTETPTRSRLEQDAVSPPPRLLPLGAARRPHHHTRASPGHVPHRATPRINAPPPGRRPANRAARRPRCQRPETPRGALLLGNPTLSEQSSAPTANRSQRSGSPPVPAGFQGCGSPSTTSVPATSAST
jgi:hypothetical protein